MSVKHKITLIALSHALLAVQSHGHIYTSGVLIYDSFKTLMCLLD